MNGLGREIIYIDDVDAAVNFGQFREGKLNGIASLTSSNGLKYQGYFKDDNMYGIGKSNSKEGTIYFGEFKDSQKHGKGILTSHEGTRQKGLFAENKFIQSDDFDEAILN